MPTADFMPRSEDEAALIVRDMWNARHPFAIRGGGTRSGLGCQVDADAVFSTGGLTGVTLYEPAEMVMSVRSGTTMREIEARLAEKGQMLPFEPMDHRLLYGTTGEPTMGGVVAGNVSGPRRIQAGAARDGLIGVRFINGRGEVVKSGGRVMKNVTGLDLVKLSCGAYGSLGVLTEVTFKLLPQPERAATLTIKNLDDSRGVAALTTAVCSPFDVSGAAHAPAGPGNPVARTLIRVEGFHSSVEHRLRGLQALLTEFGPSSTMDGEDSARAWRDIRDVARLARTPETAIWRVSVKPTDGPRFIRALSTIETAGHFYDWSGGLVWLAVPPEGNAAASAIRAAVSRLGGHATLVRAPDTVRAAVDVFEPLAKPLMKITAGIKASVDPARIVNPAVMYAGV